MTLDRLDTIIAFAAIMLGVSLIITLLTQMVGMVLALRGAYLKNGLIELLVALDPALESQAEAIATSILTHTTTSDSFFMKWKFIPTRWKLATSLRPNELLRVLKISTAGTSAEGRVTALLNEVNPELVREATVLAATVNVLAPREAVSADQLVKQLSQKADQAVGKVEAWFNSTMDRVSQRFAVQMRIWTVVFALLIAVFAHLDAFKVFSQLSSDPMVREGIVATSSTLMKQATTVSQSATQTIPAVYTTAWTQLQSQEPAVKSLGNIPVFYSRADADQWLGSKLSGNGQAQVIVNKYNEMVDQQLRAMGDQLADQYVAVNQALQRAGFNLIPSPYPGLDFGNDNLWGILAAAGLLSLGAPFWFNALKTLSNLRPIVANKQEAES